jgi:hypothetical protein
MPDEEHRIGMVALTHGATLNRGLHELAAVLGEDAVERPDETGLFDVRVTASSQDEALERVWDAVAASGADDEIAFAEHPSLPEHWRHRARAPRG